MSREQLHQEEVVVDWSIVAVGGGIGLLGLAALAVTLTWMYFIRPPAQDEPVTASGAPTTWSAPGDVPEQAISAPLVLNQPLEIKRPPRPKPAPTVARTAPVPEPRKPAVEHPAETFEPRVLSNARFPLRAMLEEEILVRELTKLPEISLADEDTSKRLIGLLRNGVEYEQATEQLAKLHTDPKVLGLPMRKEKDCTLDKEEARNLVRYSREIHGLMPGLYGEPARVRRPVRSTSSFSESSFSEAMAQEYLVGTSDIAKAALPAMVQIAQTEGREQRLALVKSIAMAQTDAATQALAKRALFDFDQEVREEALVKLLWAEEAKYRNVLVDGLRYPWPPIADQAADALVTLQMRQAIPALIDMLDQPDPAAPFQNAEKKWVVRELVRINHLRNCLLCHAPHDAKSVGIPASIPTPGVKIPVVYYGQGRSGSFVRADITYLRQDFSTKLQVDDHGAWPKMQRHDFVVRTRELTETEIKAASGKPASTEYPQRQAVLHVLRRLTGRDAGSHSQAWRELLAKQPDLASHQK